MTPPTAAATQPEAEVQATGAPRRFLLIFKGTGFLRHFAGTIELLLQRGHRVEAYYESMSDAPQYAEDTARLEAYPNFSGQALPRFRKDPRDRQRAELRYTWDYLRYYHPAFRNADFLRDRVAPKVPPRILAWGRRGLFRIGLVRRLGEALLRRREWREPVKQGVEEFVAAHEPDLVVLSPLIWFGSQQTEYVKAAAHLGIPSVLCVASWDNLSNKGAVRIAPDHVVVWNETQVEEAVDFHGVARRRLIATGAQTFDPWFDRRPSRSREAFLAEHGLPAGGKLVVYLCSSASIGGAERSFIEAWLAALRASERPLIAGAAVLVRPHPKNLKQWREGGMDLGAGAAVWPVGDEGFYGDSGRDSLFDTLYHADVLVGLNTTAMIEAAILEKPVLTPQLLEFAQVRQGTEEMYHFKYIRADNGGFVRIAGTMDEHLDQLDEALADPSRYRLGARAFVDRFVRPFGRDQRATDRLADVLEDLAGRAASEGRRAGG
ncbi:hypothetical protein SAMN06265365_107202 [Tistlia consotensis]|uniref:CDP-Glycerol:Poly(Glycerophosphate) glycerophosphotransferase n=1 Tax=Tistlia consotensis USBA 355 TaxID=560819 RepID=A0A1Y6BB60_9PROT|nr:hypothetical protein [Tistlia consotensis]SME98761.1 hypothetical protein SAMN05428998_102204 [Tistlia consotensis USBA 355]SNR58155.1 hypothetical protein SAMN06265365_107202 [Tistlia consotensis]